MFVNFLPLFVLISMITYSFDQLCQSNETITRAFIVGHNIYFAQNNSFWTFNLKDLKVSHNNQSLTDIFKHWDEPPNGLTIVTTFL
jgi:hypothetical protein